MSWLFWPLAVLLIAGGLATISLRNAVHASLALVGTLLTLALLFVTLSAHFLAAVQVIVYAGAIMVLFLFVIMLLNASRPTAGPDPLPWLRPLALVGGAVLTASLAVAALSFRAPLPLGDAETALRGGAPGPVGEVLFTRFLLPFEAVSILLLVAIVGAVSLVQRDPAAARSTRPEAASGSNTAPPEPVSGLGTPDRSVTRGPRTGTGNA